MNTNAILNVDNLNVRKHEKRVTDLQKEEVRTADIAQMKTDLADIKAMLRQMSNSSIHV